MSLLSPDIIYFCGQSIPWDPRRKDLGGSEQAVVELSRHWASHGLRVVVYATIPEPIVLDGVDYQPLAAAGELLRADVIILWRLYGLLPYLHEHKKFQCRRLLVDFHDRELFGHEGLLFQRIGGIHDLMFKSRFHADYLISKLPADQQSPLRERVRVIPNGIRKQDFTLREPPTREPHRFCYASCYLRGLIPLISFFWPRVRQIWPDAELHVYYGMDHVRDPAIREQITALLATEGVHDHGRQPVSVICEEKYRSSFHLYYTASVIETDCISIKESAFAGCIPLISNVNVFRERAGVALPGNAISEEDYRQAANAFASWVLNLSQEEYDKIRASLRADKSLLDWRDVSSRWSQELEMVPPSLSWENMIDLANSLMKSSGQSTSAPNPKSPPAIKPTCTKELTFVSYINMPSSTDRDHWMSRQLKQSFPSGIVERFEAIVGREHVLTDDEKKLFASSNFLRSPYALNIVGNALSHIALWKRVALLPHESAALILQDDAILIAGFGSCVSEILANFPVDAPLVMIADHQYALFEKFIPVDLERQDMAEREKIALEKITPQIGRHNDQWAGHCSLGYIITPDGAKGLLNFIQQNGFHVATDFLIRNYLVSEGKNYFSIRCLATSSSDVFTSNIFKR